MTTDDDSLFLLHYYSPLLVNVNHGKLYQVMKSELVPTLSQVAIDGNQFANMTYNSPDDHSLV